MFTQQVRALVTAGCLDQPVTIVFEGQTRAGPAEADEDGVEVVHAPGGGDDTIASVAESNRGAVVVTADQTEVRTTASTEVLGSRGSALCPA